MLDNTIRALSRRLAPGMKLKGPKTGAIYTIEHIISIPSPENPEGRLAARASNGEYYEFYFHYSDGVFEVPDMLFVDADISIEDLPDMKRTKLRPIHRILQAKSEDE